MAPHRIRSDGFGSGAPVKEGFVICWYDYDKNIFNIYIYIYKIDTVNMAEKKIYRYLKLMIFFKHECPIEIVLIYSM